MDEIQVVKVQPYQARKVYVCPGCNQQIAVGLYPAIQVSQEILDRTDAWLAEAEPGAALRRLVSESRSGVERALKAQAADARQ